MNFLATVCAGVTIPEAIPTAVKLVVDLIKIGVPIILVILGMIDMGKAVSSQKEDEIKKGQQTLIKRCVAAAIVFFVVAIVQLVVNLVAKTDSSQSTVWASCICKFVGGCAK